MRRPKKTVTINLADYLSAGTYNVKVKSKGTDIRDSADSNSVECVVAASGYDLTIIGSFEGGQWLQTGVKVNEPPANVFDGTYIDTSGNISGSTNYSNVSKIYIWASSSDGGAYILNGGNYTSISGSNNYANPIEITLTQNTTITIIGGND